MQWLRMIPSEEGRKSHRNIRRYFTSVGEAIVLSESDPEHRKDDDDEDDDDDDDDDDGDPDQEGVEEDEVMQLGLDGDDEIPHRT